LAISAHGHWRGHAGDVHHFIIHYMNVLVFKTSMEDPLLVKVIKPSMDGLVGDGKWNFDLNDCDRILRIASPTVKPESAIQLMERFGVQCAELEN